MSHILTKQTYEELLEGISQTKKWLNGLNIRFSKSRFGQYEKSIKLLNEYFQKGKVKEFLKMTDFEDIMVSLNESTEIVEIHEQLKDLNPEFLRKKLKLIIKGPFLTKKESSEKGTNLARNIFYELYTMAVLKRSGFEILLEKPSDVSCKFESRTFLFECKRPQTKKSVARNFFSAVGQLTKNLSALEDTNPKGIVAICISKIMNRGDRFLVGRNEDDLSNKIAGILKGTVRQFEHLQRNIVDTRIIGIFYHLNTPAVIQDIDLLTNVQEIAINNTCLPDSSDFLILKRIESKLKLLKI